MSSPIRVNFENLLAFFRRPVTVVIVTNTGGTNHEGTTMTTTQEATQKLSDLYTDQELSSWIASEQDAYFAHLEEVAASR